MSQTTYLNNLLDEIGHSVHCMNTIAVSLSYLTNDTQTPKELSISWNSGDIKKSSKNSRRFAIKSSIVYCIESLYEYLTEISKNPFWLKSKKSFTDNNNKNLSKATRTVRLLKDIESLDKEWIILVELLCHWRNRIVHTNSSNANISKPDERYLLSQEDKIYQNYRHFSVSTALNNFNVNKFTLKDVTTLITIVIKCTKKIDEKFLLAIKSLSLDEIIDIIKDEEFNKIKNQTKSDKKDRQLKKWLSIHYNFLEKNTIDEIVKNI